MLITVKNTKLSRWEESEEAGLGDFDPEESASEEELFEDDENSEGEVLE